MSSMARGYGYSSTAACQRPFSCYLVQFFLFFFCAPCRSFAQVALSSRRPPTAAVATSVTIKPPSSPLLRFRADRTTTTFDPWPPFHYISVPLTLSVLAASELVRSVSGCFLHNVHGCVWFLFRGISVTIVCCLKERHNSVERRP